MDMIERVARAIHAAEMGSDIIYDECADIARDMARAAIEEMMGPTKDMIRFAAEQCATTDLSSTEDFELQYAAVWDTMIEAALNPPAAKAPR